jgi:hypothetical protein
MIRKSMTEVERLSEFTGWINLDFVKPERTPHEISEKGIR